MAKIRPATRLSAQPAAVSGGAFRVITAAPDIQAQSAVVDSTAKQVSQGIGAIQAQSASTSAAAAIARTGSGALQAQSAQVTGRDPVDTQAWQWDTPSLQDETDFYTNVLGWNIPAGEPSFDDSFSGANAWKTPPSFGFGTLNSDTEADDMWIWYEQYKRYGASFIVRGSDTVGDWYNEVRTTYINELITRYDTDATSPTEPDNGLYSHLYGQGLAADYNDTGDPAVLAVLDNLRAKIISTPRYQSLLASNPVSVAYSGLRGAARHAIVAAYAYQATSDPAWEAVRDNLVIAFETATDWRDYNSTVTSMVEGAGMYLSDNRGAYNNNVDVSGSSYANGGEAYDDGWRYSSTFMIGLAAEALWRMYVQTGSEVLRTRLIQMARYVQYYAHDPSWNYPNVGAYFGNSNVGGRWWSRDIVQTRTDGTFAQADVDTSYDASLVGVMVMGYKLTGEIAMLEKARTFFKRCNRWYGNGGIIPGTGEDDLVKYMDTTPNTADNKFRWNKTVLGYAYPVMENGGDVQQINQGGFIEGEAASMASNTWRKIGDSAQGGETEILRQLKTYDGGNAPDFSSIFEFSHSLFWNPNEKELHFRGGIQTGIGTTGIGGIQRHIRFSDKTGKWEAMTPFLSGQAWIHEWGHFCGDPRTGDLYFRQESNNEIYKWTYTKTPSTDPTGSDSWPLAGSTPFVWNQTSAALGFFPDYNGGDGCLVAYDTPSQQLLVTDREINISGSWTEIEDQVFPLNGGFETVMTYCPGRKIMLVGGGKASTGSQSRIAKIEADGTVTEIQNVPFNWGANGSGHVVGDDRIFALDMVSETLTEYDEGGDSWSSSGLAQPPFGSEMGYWALCMIPEHKVIYVAAQLSGQGGDANMQEWLYKL